LTELERKKLTVFLNAKLIKNLELEDIIIKKEVEYPIIKYYYIEENITKTTNPSVYPSEISFNPKEKTVELNERYMDNGVFNIDSIVLKKQIDKMLEKEKTKFMLRDTDGIKTVMDFLNLMKWEIQMRIRRGSSNIQLIMSKNMYDRLYYYLDSLQEKILIYDIGTNIIMYNKPENNDQSCGYRLFHTNNRYAIEEMGNYSEHFEVIEVKELNDERQKKLERIINR